MRKLLLAIGLLLFLAVPVLAGDYSYNRRNSQKYRYRSYSGQRYQYDLSKIPDRLQYGLDIPAQMRDSLSVPRQLDRNMGQHGGGICPGWKR